MRDAKPYEADDERDDEPGQPAPEPELLDNPAFPVDEAPDAADDDIGALRITSLRPAPRPFSMRRLLNWGSLIVAVITLLALLIVWLPGAVSQLSGSSSTQTGSSLGNRVSSERGDGWQPIGPSWAQDVAFAADGRTGYICGPTGLGDTPVLVARFDVRTALVNTWSETTNPATGAACSTHSSAS